MKERNQIVASISKEEINALAKKHLNSKEMSIVVVGDAKKLRPELQALGFAVEDFKL